MSATATAADRFRDAVLARDPDAMEAVLADDVVFRSPAVHQPYDGRVATMVVLRARATGIHAAASEPSLPARMLARLGARFRPAGAVA